MDEQDNNPTNTQDADEQMPVSNAAPDMDNGSEDRQGMPTPNNGEGGDQNSNTPPTGGDEDEDSTNTGENDQQTGATFDDHQ